MRLKFLKRKIIIILISLIILFIATVFILHTQFIESKVLKYALGYLEREKKLHLMVQSLDYDLLKLQFIFRGVVLYDKNNSCLPPFFQADEIKIKIPLAFILGKKLQIQELGIQNPRINIHFDLSGSNNIPFKVRDRTQSSSRMKIPEYVFNQSYVENASLYFSDEKKNLQLKIPGIYLMLEWIGEGKHSLLLQTEERGSASYLGKDYQIVDLVTKAELNYQGVNFDDVKLLLSQNELKLTGRFDYEPSPYLNLKLRGRVQLKDIQTALLLNKDFSGNLNFQSFLRGPLDTVEASFNLQGDDLSYENLGNIKFKADGLWKDNLLTIPSLQVEVAGGKLRGKGGFHPLDWEAGNNIDLLWESIDLEDLVSLFPNFFHFASKTSGSGHVFFTRFAPDSLKAQAEIHLYAKGQGASAQGRMPVSGCINADIDSGKVTFSTKNLSIPGARLKGEAHLEPKKLSGTFSLDVQDLKSVSPLFLVFSRNFTKKDLDHLDLGGEIQISGELKGKVSSPFFRAKLSSKKISIHNFKELEVEGTVIYDSGEIRFDPLIFRDGEGTIKMSGFYPIETFQSSMTIEISGEHLSLERIIKAFDLDIDIRAQMKLNTLIKGNLKEPTVQSSLVFTEVSFFNQNFERVEISGSYQDNEIILETLKAIEARDRIEASGHYNFENESYKVRVSVDSLRFEDLQLLRTIGLVKATVDFQLEGEGRLDSPQFKAKGLLKDVAFGAQQIGELQIVADSSGELLKFQILAPLYASTMEGTLRLSPPFPLEAMLKFDNLNLEEFKNQFLSKPSRRYAGNLTAQINLNLDLSRPQETLKIQAEVEKLQLKMQQYLLQNEAPVRISLDSEAFQIEDLRLKGPGMEIQAQGALPFKKHSPEGLLLKGNMNLDLGPGLIENLQAQGTLRVNALVIGSFSNPELSAALDIYQAWLLFPKLPLALEDVECHLKVSQNVISLESFAFRSADGKFRLKGDVPLGSLPLKLAEAFPNLEKRQIDLKFMFQNFDPAILKPFLPKGIFDQISGEIGGKAEIKGESFRLGELESKISFDKLGLNIFGLFLEQERPIEIFLSNNEARIDSFSLKGEENHLFIQGKVGLTGKKALDLVMEGEVELKLLKAFFKGSVFSGESLFRIDVTEDLTDPLIQGFMEIQEAGMKMAYPNIIISQANGRFQFDQNRIRIEQFQGEINGGKLTVEGDMSVVKRTLSGAALNLNINNLFLYYPSGLRSQVSGKLGFESDGKRHFLNGTTEIINAKYVEPVSVESAIFQYLLRGSTPEVKGERNKFLENLNLNIAIITVNDFLIENNISKSEIRIDLKIEGTLLNPGMTGRAFIEEGGEIYFGHNTFFVEQGTIDFINPNRIEPDLNLSARTQIGEYDIQLILQGTPEKFSAYLISNPSLSEANIISLLVTGKTLESTSTSVANMAGHKGLSYLDNALTGKLEQATRQSLGLESVRIDASLVSTEENPRARITIGQHITPSFELVFSQDLKDARNQTWILNYNPIQEINMQGIKRDNNEHSLALRHEFRFGLAKMKRDKTEEGERKGLVIREITFRGTLGVSEEKIRSLMKTVEGKRFDFFRFKRDLDRIHKFYLSNNYLGYSLSAKREDENGRLNLTIDIDSGPKIFFEYQGAHLPKKFKRHLENIWSGGSFGQWLIKDAEHQLLLYLFKKRFYQAAIQTEELISQDKRKTILFRITKGIRYAKTEINYLGNRSLPNSALNRFLEKNNLTYSLFLNLFKAKKSLENFYAAYGFLRSNVELPKIHFEPDDQTVIVTFAIEEGPRFKVGKIVINGNWFFGESKIKDEMLIREGEIFSSKKIKEANLRIKELYAQRGFTRIDVQSSIRVQEEKGLVDSYFQIEEHQQAVIEEIHISGNLLTKPGIIRRELMFHEGDIVNYKTISESRKRLYDLGIFERVNIDAIPLSEVSEHSPENRANFKRLYRMEINVSEIKPYRARYGFQYDTETSFGFNSELVNRNLIGLSHLIGTSIRVNRDERDLRAFFRSHHFFSLNIRTELFTFFNRNIKHAFTVDRVGFTFQQQVEMSKFYLLSYSYTLERRHTFRIKPQTVFTLAPTLRIGILNATLARDTRDSIFNARRGTFLSQSVEYAPEFLGSEVEFIRYFGQFFAYKSLNDFIVYAFGLRIGLGEGLGGELIPSERFFAGGATTIRGFGKDEIGPREPYTGVPTGGNAVFIMNHELRFSIHKRVSGAVFLDLGNVYAKVNDFDPFDVRESAGFGLRYKTSFVLLRIDWGFKLYRRPGESLSEIFLSIGQAF